MIRFEQWEVLYDLRIRMHIFVFFPCCERCWRASTVPSLWRGGHPLTSEWKAFKPYIGSNVSKAEGWPRRFHNPQPFRVLSFSFLRIDFLFHPLHRIVFIHCLSLKDRKLSWCFLFWISETLIAKTTVAAMLAWCLCRTRCRLAERRPVRLLSRFKWEAINSSISFW